MTAVNETAYPMLVGGPAAIWATCTDCGAIETSMEIASFEFCGIILEFNMERLISIEGYDDGYGYRYQFSEDE